MSDFVAGFAARHAVAAGILQAAFAPPPGFAPGAPIGRVSPKHFSPANPAENPTEGWNPLDAAAEPSPFVDPLQAAHAAGYAEGLAAAANAAAATRTRDEALLTGVASALGGQIDREAIAAQLRQTVLLLVTRIVGDVGVAGDRLAQRVDVAADMLADSAESAILRVHPEDVALIQGRLPASIFPVGDANLSRGSFVLESASTVIEDGPALWLEQLASAIDRVPLPPSSPPPSRPRAAVAC
jgi:flagellar assembly protein FliH